MTERNERHESNDGHESNGRKEQEERENAPHSPREARTFVDEGVYALEALFEGLDLRWDVLKSKETSIQELKDERDERLDFITHEASDRFVRASEAARARFRVAEINEEIAALRYQESGDLKDLYAQTEGTAQSMAALAGAILQFGKQALSYRYGGRKRVPFEDMPYIAGCSVGYIIWIGRNHAAHWEEASFNKHESALLKRLIATESIPGPAPQPGQSYAADLVRVLRWHDADDARETLKKLVSFAAAPQGQPHNWPAMLFV